MYTSLILLTISIAVICGADTPPSSTIIMADIQYNAPQCLINRTTGGGRNQVSLDNRLGQLSVGHDLLEGRELQFTLVLDNQQRSCKMCQLVPDQYCTTVLGNASQLRLAYDTSYNFQAVVFIGSDDGTYPPSSSAVGTWMLSSGDVTSAIVTTTPVTIALPLVFNNITGACGHTLRLVVTALVNIERPIARDMMLVAEQVAGNVMPCITAPGSSGRIAPLDCRTADQFYYLVYPMYNCLGEVPPENNNTDNDPIYYSPYYYYYQVWQAQQQQGPLVIDTDVIPPRKLCGERWSLLFLYTRLDRYCNPEVQRYVALKPWYEAALEAMTAWLNKRYHEPALWLLLNTLERTCALRDSTGQISLNDTVFADMLAELRRGGDNNVVNGKETMCEWMGEADPSIISESSDLDTISRVLNVTLPAYIAYLDKWYFTVFKYVVRPDAELPRHAIMLSLMAWIVLGLVLVSVAFTTYHVFFRPSEYALNHGDSAYQIIH